MESIVSYIEHSEWTLHMTSASHIQCSRTTLIKSLNEIFSENEIPPKYTSAFSCVLVCSFGQHRAQKWHRFIWSLLITWLRNEAYEPQFCIAKRAIQRQQQNRPRQKKKSSTSRSCVLQSWHNVLLFVRMARKKTQYFDMCVFCVFSPHWYRVFWSILFHSLWVVFSSLSHAMQFILYGHIIQFYMRYTFARLSSWDDAKNPIEEKERKKQWRKHRSHSGKLWMVEMAVCLTLKRIQEEMVIYCCCTNFAFFKPIQYTSPTDIYTNNLASETIEIIADNRGKIARRRSLYTHIYHAPFSPPRWGSLNYHSNL